MESGNIMRRDFNQTAAKTPDASPDSTSANPPDTHEGLLAENELLHAVVDHFPGGILLYDKDLRLVICNQKQKELLDYPPALFEFGMPSLEQIFRFNAIRGEYGPGNTEAHVRERVRLAALREPHVFERIRPNGTVLQIRGVPLPGGGFLTTYLDVTKETHRQTVPEPHNPHADPVTGLPNWTLFLDRFDQVMSRVRRGQIAALHFFDLDRFKEVEAQLGRKVADGLLQGAALRVRNAARATDTVSRYNDDEFVVLQPEVDRPSSVARLSTRIVDALRQPFEIQGYTIGIGASVGLALIPRDGTNAEELLTIARSNMQRARQEAKDMIGANDEAEPVFKV